MLSSNSITKSALQSMYIDSIPSLHIFPEAPGSYQLQVCFFSGQVQCIKTAEYFMYSGAQGSSPSDLVELPLLTRPFHSACSIVWRPGMKPVFVACTIFVKPNHAGSVACYP